MPQAKTIIELLEHGKDAAPAVSSPDRQSLTYAGLRSLMNRTVVKLNELGIGRNDPVAIVLPNGPEMASAFVSLAAGATTAPLKTNLNSISPTSMQNFSSSWPALKRLPAVLPKISGYPSLS